MPTTKSRTPIAAECPVQVTEPAPPEVPNPQVGDWVVYRPCASDDPDMFQGNVREGEARPALVAGVTPAFDARPERPETQSPLLDLQVLCRGFDGAWAFSQNRAWDPIGTAQATWSPLED